MADSTAPEDVPTYPSLGAACNTCKTPDMSDMTWYDGANHFFSTLLATPSMGPIGYILESPYSPL